MKIRLDAAYLAVLLMSLPGYPLLVAAANLAGLPGAASSTASMIMRTLNVIVAALLILCSFGRRRDSASNVITQILIVFWAAYFVRMFFDTFIYPDALWQEPYYYWIWAVGGSFIPMLGLARSPQQIEGTDTLFIWFFYATFAACLLAAFAASGTKVDDVGSLVETGRGRIGDDRLNPISLGHLGAMLVIQSIWAIIFFPPWRTVAMRLLVVVALCFGLYVLILANSRGPIVAAIGCLILISLFAPLRQKLLAVLLSGIGVAAILPLAQYVEDNHGISTFSRIFGMSVAESVEQSSRLGLFADALKGFWKNPWIGSSLEIPSVGGYPHNVVIESFMALGIFFGSLVVAAIALLCMRSLSLFSKYPRYSWPCLIFMQYLIGAQFSGSLYGSTYLWASVGLIVSLRTRAYGVTPQDPRNRPASLQLHYP
jgi:hypothetical protein